MPETPTHTNTDTMNYAAVIVLNVLSFMLYKMQLIIELITGAELMNMMDFAFKALSIVSVVMAIRLTHKNLKKK